MSLKIKNKRKTQKRSGLEADTDPIRILRTLNYKEAFYFYEDIGKPTGEIARSLSDFLEKIKTVKSESLVFHLQRKDFQNWIKKTLGDSKLARRIGRIAPLCNNSLRMKIQATVESRIKELGGGPVTFLVNEDLAVTLSSSTS